LAVGQPTRTKNNAVAGFQDDSIRLPDRCIAEHLHPALALRDTVASQPVPLGIRGFNGLVDGVSCVMYHGRDGRWVRVYSGTAGYCSDTRDTRRRPARPTSGGNSGGAGRSPVEVTVSRTKRGKRRWESGASPAEQAAREPAAPADSRHCAPTSAETGGPSARPRSGVTVMVQVAGKADNPRGSAAREHHRLVGRGAQRAVARHRTE
jgi:hypothetical protein